MFLLQIILVVAIALFYFLAEESPVVETDLGKVRGSYKTSYDGRQYSAFEGIPYAKPPIGSLRFQPPQKVDPWLGTWQATKLYKCIQLVLGNAVTENVIGEEDCLYINVYTPREKPSPDDNLDVIFHIHGGGFQYAAGHEYTTPHFLMDRDVIFVSMNYRLGMLGFLSTGDSVSPGNNGLKDQVLALEWVQEHIGRFGGNKSSVTITGFSAGAAAVHFHYFSPLSKGLFHRAFSHSGTATSSFAIQEGMPERTKKAAEFSGCLNDSSTEHMVNCLRRRPAKQLYSQMSQFIKSGILPLIIYGPTVEPKLPGAFLTEDPYKLLNDGEIINDVPWINSYTSEEGISLAFVYGLMESLDFLEENFNEVHRFIETAYTAPENRKLEIAEKIRNYYFEDKITLSSMIKLLTDRIFAVDAIRASQMQAAVAISPVYQMVYSYVGDISMLDRFFGKRPEGENIFMGTSHGDDVALLYATFPEKKLSEEDEKVKDILVDMLVSYATTGVPHVKGVNWEPVSATQVTYLHFESSNNITSESITNFETREFWDSLNLKEHENLPVVKDEL